MNDKNKDKLNNTFGVRLKEIRKARGLTQQALAEKAGIDDKHLCRIENGKYFPTHATLNKLLTALDLSIDEVGLNLEQIKINNNPIMAKALQILNSAKNDEELLCYLESLKATQKALDVTKSRI
ncbi:helix-turn-helix transcriptional regulator [bacterium]|nr:helix-turn-helix transcriptional regulator [bacterium]